MIEFPVVDFAAAPACVGFAGACGAPAGAACEPGCPSWASDDLPLVPFALGSWGSLAGEIPSDDPWVLPGAEFAPEPF